MIYTTTRVRRETSPVRKSATDTAPSRSSPPPPERRGEAPRQLGDDGMGDAGRETAPSATCGLMKSALLPPYILTFLRIAGEMGRHSGHAHVRGWFYECFEAKMLPRSPACAHTHMLITHRRERQRAHTNGEAEPGGRHPCIEGSFPSRCVSVIPQIHRPVSLALETQTRCFSVHIQRGV